MAKMVRKEENGDFFLLHP